MPLRLFFNLAVLAFLLLSCGHNRDVAEDIPEALQDSKLSAKSLYRSEDLVEALYAEVLKNDPALKQFDRDLVDFQQNSHKALQPFRKYHQKSESYYQSVQYKAGAIQDTVLRAKILALVQEHQEQYARRIAQHQGIMWQFEQNTQEINDLYILLKLSLTLPLIAQYQGSQLPKTEALKGVIQTQAQLKKQGDALLAK
jgi:hypothetical protein